MKVRREFHEQWKTKYKWLREAKHEGKIVMKCIYCEMHKAIRPWGIGTGFSTLQHDSIVVHASSSIHKLSQAKRICGNGRKSKPITEHIVCIDDSEQGKSHHNYEISLLDGARIFTTLKI